MTDCYMGEGVEGKASSSLHPPSQKNHFNSAPEPYKLKILQIKNCLKWLFDLRFVDLAGFSKWFTKYLSGFQGRPRLSSCIFCICWCTLILGLSKTFDLLFNMKITKNISKVSNTFLFYSTTVVQIHNNQSINQATIASSDSFLLWHTTYLAQILNYYIIN